MTPAKLLGLPQTDDSIMVRAGVPVRTLPRAFVHVDLAAQDDDTDKAGRALRRLIALRKRGENE